MNPAPIQTPEDDGRPIAKYWRKGELVLDVWHPQLQILKTTVMEFCYAWRENSPDIIGKRQLVIFGATGVGKSHCTKAIKEFAISETIVACRKRGWRETPEIQRLAWPAFFYRLSNRDEGAAEVMESACTYDLLILDDVGSEADRFKSGEPMDVVGQVLSARDHLWTVVTTNVHRRDWAKNWSDRIADRLERNCFRIVNVSDVPSYTMRVQ